MNHDLKNIPLYPFLFEGNYHTALWGGTLISDLYGRKGVPVPCSESWEVSGHPAAPSTIANGPLAGRTLADVTAVYGRALLGTKATDPARFPLLFKIIDAKKRLSIQVHPNEKTALLTGGEPKTEMWHVLAGKTPEQHTIPIFAGLRSGVTVTDVSSAAETGRFEEIVIRHNASPDDCFFIPGGLVHAIGENALIYEVQQSSDTTYRLWDWGRVGADGRPRTLHLKESLRSIDFTLPPPKILRDSVSCPFFTFTTLRLDAHAEKAYPAAPESFTVLFAADRPLCVEWDGGMVQVSRGGSLLVPAGCAFRLRGEGKVLMTTL